MLLPQPLNPLPYDFWTPLQTAEDEEALEEAIRERRDLVRRIMVTNLSGMVGLMQAMKREFPIDWLSNLTPDMKRWLYLGPTEGISGDMYEKHLAMRVLGKSQAAGTFQDANEADAALIQKVADRQAQYWRNFTLDVLAPAEARRARYELPSGDLRTARLNWRTGLYLDRLDGSFAEGWLNGQPRGVTAAWRLGFAEHCPTCIYRASLGFQPVSFWSSRGWFPKSGTTECKVKCKCHFESGRNATGGGEVGGVVN